jgi:hypothetical protein
MSEQQARAKLILELTAERDAANWKAAELEKRADKAGAAKLRDKARELERRVSELEDEAEHDDDRGGIER